MDRLITVACLIVIVILRPASPQNALSDTVLNCCEGDVLFLLDSSGSVSSYEYSHLLGFLSDLLSPFSLGPGHVRVALLQVGTVPHLEFDFEAHSTQLDLQEALRDTRQLKGDTNTVEALKLAQEQLFGQSQLDIPKVLVWLTDGVQPGAVEGPMAELRQSGVAVLTLSTGHGNYKVLQEVVTPPSDAHLYFVDIDHINIITRDFRNAIIELIRADRLQVQDVSTHSARLQWRPVLSASTGSYEVVYGVVRTGSGSGESRPGSGTSPSTSGVEYIKMILPGNAWQTTLSDLQSDTTYTVTLTPHSTVDAPRALSVSFTTKPDVLGPTVVSVSELGPKSVKLHWGPHEPNSVERYQVEYGTLPRGKVQIIPMGRHQNSMVLTGLQPDTQYLVTVSAHHSSGQERAMSIKVCTQEELPALSDLQLTTVDRSSVQVQWTGDMEGLQGYWVSWEREDNGYSGRTSFRYLPPDSITTLLTNLAPASRVCVSPVYRTARGEGLCCTAHLQSASGVYGSYSSPQPH